MYDIYENRKIKGIYKSRYVASFWNVGGYKLHLEGWLRQLKIDGETLTDEEIQEIVFYARSGKKELEENANAYLEQTFS